MKSSRHPEQVVQAALERLRAGSRAAECAGLGAPIRFRHRPRAQRAAERIVRWLEAPRDAARRPDAGPRRLWRLAGDTAGVLALRLLSERPLRKAVRGWAAAVSRRQKPSAPSARRASQAFVAAQDETALVRHALLLRLAAHHGAAADLLMARTRSGADAARSRFWLSFLLREAGDAKAAALLEATSAPAPVARPAPTPAFAAPVRGAVAVLAMFDSEVLRASLRSLVRSDFTGEIVVVEDGDGTSCAAFCRELGVAHHSNGAWLGNAASTNAGLARLANHPDVVIVAHSDVLWPPRWWDTVARAWGRLLPTRKVGLLNLSYLQIGPTPEPVLATLFRRGEYDDLAWLLRQMRGIDGLSTQVEHSVVDEGGISLGLSRDAWSDMPAEGQRVAGRFSVAASFPLALWTDMGRFDPAMTYGCDLQLQAHCLRAHQWMLWINQAPLVHLVSSDTRSLDRERRHAFKARVSQTYAAFKATYGVTVADFLSAYFAETAPVHEHRIVQAVNEGRFDDVEFVFDEFWSRIPEAPPRHASTRATVES